MAVLQVKPLYDETWRSCIQLELTLVSIHDGVQQCTILVQQSLLCAACVSVCSRHGGGGVPSTGLLTVSVADLTLSSYTSPPTTAPSNPHSSNTYIYTQSSQTLLIWINNWQFLRGGGAYLSGARLGESLERDRGK